MQMHESAEMYLETILVLSKRMEHVKGIDIAEEMNFSTPSVSIYLKELRNNGYVAKDASGYVVLTDKGREIAERVYERHTVLTKFLKAIGVSDETADADACKIEHDISQETFECMKAHYNKHNH